ncbi:TRAP transporter small permease subunit [Pikeienuella sp. HZG-20]|uniref:TRAP transporter small permease subunit n=1 Tax=Paludibacillus litoralis TaxID=3133267 RepID=UPI0030EDDA82
MRTILDISAALDVVARAAGKAVGWLMLPLIAVIMFDVTTRKIGVTQNFFADFTIDYGYSISTIMQDLQWHLHAAMLLLSFGFGYLTNAHVRVDVFRELLPRRKQGWLELVGLLVLGLPFLILMMVYGWELFHVSWIQNEHSESVTGLNWRWFIKFFMPVGFALTLLAVIATLGRLVVYLFGSEFDEKAAIEALEIFADDYAELEAARLAAEAALRAEAEEL